MKAFAKVRYGCVDRAEAGGSFGQVAEMAGHRPARLLSCLAVASIIVLCTMARAAPTPDIFEQKFDGVVAPRLWVQVVPRWSL